MTVTVAVAVTWLYNQGATWLLGGLNRIFLGYHTNNTAWALLMVPCSVKVLVFANMRLAQMRFHQLMHVGWHTQLMSTIIYIGACISDYISSHHLMSHGAFLHHRCNWPIYLVPWNRGLKRRSGDHYSLNIGSRSWGQMQFLEKHWCCRNDGLFYQFSLQDLYSFSTFFQHFNIRKFICISFF